MMNLVTKEFLKEAYILDKRLQDKKDELENIRSLATSIGSPSFSEKRGSGTNDKVGNMVSTMLDLVDEIVLQTTELLRKKYDIALLIQKVNNEESKRILELRYIKYLEWEVIADEMGFSRVHTIRIHNKGIEQMNNFNTL